MGPTEIFRPLFSRVLAYAVWAILAAAAGSSFFTGDTLLSFRVTTVSIFLAVAVWLFYVRPYVEVSDGGIAIVNPLRTIHIPWPAITKLYIHGSFIVETRNAENYSAYAAVITNKRNNLGVAGEVKSFAEHRMNSLIEAGFLDDVRSEGATVTNKHNTIGITLLTASALLFVVSLVI